MSVNYLPFNSEEGKKLLNDNIEKYFLDAETHYPYVKYGGLRKLKNWELNVLENMDNLLVEDINKYSYSKFITMAETAEFDIDSYYYYVQRLFKNDFYIIYCCYVWTNKLYIRYISENEEQLGTSTIRKLKIYNILN